MYTGCLKLNLTLPVLLAGFCMYSHSRLLHGTQHTPVIIKGVPELAPSLTDTIRTPLMGPMGSKR